MFIGITELETGKNFQKIQKIEDEQLTFLAVNIFKFNRHISEIQPSI